MGGDGVGNVQDLGDGEVVQVAVEALDAVGGPFGGGCGRPPRWYSIAQSQICQYYPSDDAEAWYAPAQACHDAHSGAKDTATAEKVVRDEMGESVPRVT